MKLLVMKFVSLVDAMNEMMAVIGGVLTAIMTIIVCYACISRYFFNAPMGWSEEAAIYLMIWGIYLGVAAALKDDKHVAVDVVMEKLSPTHKFYAHCFHFLVALVFLSVLLWKGIEMVQLSHTVNNLSIATEFPLHYVELAVPVGVFLLILQVIAKMLKQICERGNQCS